MVLSRFIWFLPLKIFPFQSHYYYTNFVSLYESNMVLINCGLISKCSHNIVDVVATTTTLHRNCGVIFNHVCGYNVTKSRTASYNFSHVRSNLFTKNLNL
jgi:hypothetical protein